MADGTTSPLTGVSALPLGQFGESFSFAPPELSQQTRDYLNVLDIVARGTKPTTGIGNYYNPLLQQSELPGDVTLPVYMTEAALSPFTSKPIEENLAYTALLRGAQGSAGQLSAGPNTPIVLINDRTGEKLVAGTGFAAAEQAAAQAQALSEKEGGKAAWSLYTAAPGTTDYYRAAQSEPQMGPLEGIGQLIKTVGPLLTAGLTAPLFAPGAAAAGGIGGALQSLGPLASAGLTTAGTSALGDTVAGRSIGDILKNAGAAGVKAMALYKLGDLTGINKLLADAEQPPVDAAATGPLGTPTFAQTAADLKAYTSGIPGFATLPGASTAPLGGVVDAADDTINVLARTAPKLTSIAGPLTSFANTATNLISGGSGSNTLRGGAGEDQLGGDTITPEENEVIVVARRQGVPDFDLLKIYGPGAAAVLAATAAGGGGAAGAGAGGTGAGGTGAGGTGAGGTGAAGAGAAGAPTSLLPEVIGAGAGTGGILGTGLTAAQLLQAGGLGISLLGDLFGGGPKSGKPGTIPGGLTTALSPTFTAKGPRFQLPSLGVPRTASDLAARGLATPQNWYRYAYGPGQSFFTGTPESERNRSLAYTGYAEGGYAEGGYSQDDGYADGGYAIGGPGDGRDDKVPAMLSDGEYVIDAETVSMLGNGSSKAGAEALDRFRVNVRKHKGRDLAKGRFSVNARKPEQYLKKGRE